VGPRRPARHLPVPWTRSLPGLPRASGTTVPGVLPAKDLPDLVRRRLWELGMTVHEVSRRARGTIAPEVIERLTRSRGRAFISARLAGHLARALDVPENRVRRAADLPEVHDPRADVPTGPHLRLVTDESSDRAAGGA
jgi:hypothetical protein